MERKRFVAPTVHSDLLKHRDVAAEKAMTCREEQSAVLDEFSESLGAKVVFFFYPCSF